MAEPAVELDAVVAASGDVVVPASAVHELALVPGQRVHVVVSPGKRRRNMRGVLAGRVRDLDPAELAAVRREAWGDLADLA